MNRLKLIFSSSIAVIVSIIFVVVITMAAEWFSALKNLLKSWSGHHWVTKSLLTMVVYFGVWFITYKLSSQPTPERLRKTLSAVSITAMLGFLSILLFFVSHY